MSATFLFPSIAVPDEIWEKIAEIVRKETASAIELALAKQKESDLISLEEMASRLKVSKSSLHAWAKKGRFPKYKMPGSNKTFVIYSEVIGALSTITPYQKVKINQSI